MDTGDYAAQLGALGYPKFSYLRARASLVPDPAKLLFDALNEADLDSRIAEGLPWLVATHADMDWDWLVCNAELHSRQNRLGFIVTLATELARAGNDRGQATKLEQQLERLEEIRFSGEDTFCHDSMTTIERSWLREHSSPTAAHWNILSDLKPEIIG